MIYLNFIIKNKVLIAISTLIAMIIFQFFYISYIKNENEKIKIEKQIIQQNSSAYKDSINQIPDSIQYYKVFVKDLQASIEKFRKENKISTKVIAIANINAKILSDSIRFYKNKKQLIVDKTDSSRYSMDISENDDDISINGKAFFYPAERFGSYDLNIVKKEIQLEAFIGLNEDKTVSALIKSNNRKIKSSTVISPELYVFMSKIDNSTFLDKITVAASAKYDFNYIYPAVNLNVPIYDIDFKIESELYNRDIRGVFSVTYKKPLIEIISFLKK